MLNDLGSHPKASKARWKAGSCSFNLFNVLGEALTARPALHCRLGVEKFLGLFALGSFLGLRRGILEPPSDESLDAFFVILLSFFGCSGGVVSLLGVVVVVECLPGVILGNFEWGVTVLDG